MNQNDLFFAQNALFQFLYWNKSKTSILQTSYILLNTKRPETNNTQYEPRPTVPSA